MSNLKTPYQFFPVNNLVTDTEFKASVVGNFIILLSYTGTGEQDVLISINGESFQVFPKGIALELPADQDFLNIRFKQVSGTTQSLGFAVTAGRVFDSRLVLSGSGITVDGSSNTVESPAPAPVTSTAAVAVAADSNTREVVLQNNGANDIWLGDSAVDPATSRGKKLEVGMECVWSNSGAIYAACAAGLTSTLSYVKLKKV